ncbi:MAG: carboxypeptidase regulatory-like domain-containing protein [Planctomycetota bacterium]
MALRRTVWSMGIRSLLLTSLLVAALPAGCVGPSAVYEGRVVDSAGAAVPEAVVSAWESERIYRDIPGPARRIGQSVTGPDGSWRVALPPDENLSWLALVAEKEGLALGWSFPDADERSEPLTLRLGEASTLAGVVVDEAGSPVAGAAVRMILRPAGEGDGSEWLDLPGGPNALTTETDRQGRFAFENVPVGHNGLFVVRAAGHAGVNTMFTMDRDGFSPPREDIRLTLPGEAKIEVLAVEKDTGKPVDGLALLAKNWRAMFPAIGRAVPDEPGRFVFDGLPTGRYEIAVADPAKGLADWTATRARVIVEAGQAARDVRLELVRGGVAEVRLTSSADGKAIAGGRVVIGGESRRHWFQLSVDEEGLGRIRLIPGDHSVRWVSAAGYVQGRPRKDFTVATGKTVRVEVTLAPKPRYRGVVTDPAGAPVAGASVCVLPDYRYVTSGRDGAFEVGKDLSSRPKRTSFLLIARLPKRNLAGAVRVGKPGKAIGVKLAPAVTVSGRVTDPAGRPIRAASVSVQAGRWDGEDLPSLGRIRTDADGRYSVEALPAGLDYTVAIRANRRMPVDVYAGRAGEPGGRVEAPTAVLPPASRDAPAPSVRRVPLPQIEDADAVWGAVSRDRRGHVWVGITMDEHLDQPSAHLVEYDPAADKAHDRGDAVTQLKRAGVYREGEGQLKVHSRICEADDGYLYFASMDEKGEDMEKEVLPTWGSHLWRYRPGAENWEHLLAMPEAMITLDAGKRYVYALGYYRHALYQYDTATGQSRSVVVGAIDAHVSRNIFTDRRDHVYPAEALLTRPGLSRPRDHRLHQAARRVHRLRHARGAVGAGQAVGGGSGEGGAAGLAASEGGGLHRLAPERPVGAVLVQLRPQRLARAV